SLFFERKVGRGEVAASLHWPVRQPNGCRPRKRHVHELLAREQAFHIRRHAFASVVQRDRPDTLLPFRGYGPPVPVPGRHARGDFRRPLFHPELQVHLLPELEGHRAVVLKARSYTGNGMSTTSSAASRSSWPAKGLASVFDYAAASNRRAL